MKQHYLNVLHTCLQSGAYLTVSNVNRSLASISCHALLLLGQNDTCRRKHGDRQHREDGTKDAEKANMPQRQRKSSNRTNSDVTLPKIVNR